MSKSTLTLVGLVVVAGLAWQVSGQQDLLPSKVDEPAADPLSFDPVVPSDLGSFDRAPNPGGDFLDPAPGVTPNNVPADPHLQARERLNRLNAHIVEQMSPEEVQRAIVAAERRIRVRAAELRFEQARAMLQEVARELPDSDVGRRAQRALDASGPNIERGDEAPDTESEELDSTGTDGASEEIEFGPLGPLRR